MDRHVSPYVASRQTTMGRNQCLAMRTIEDRLWKRFSRVWLGISHDYGFNISGTPIRCTHHFRMRCNVPLGRYRGKPALVLGRHHLFSSQLASTSCTPHRIGSHHPAHMRLLLCIPRICSLWQPQNASSSCDIYASHENVAR
jgi:hypothetical protein